MNNRKTCNDCKHLIKRYENGETLQFTACCGLSKVYINGLPKLNTIKRTTGPMVPLEVPMWCPLKDEKEVKNVPIIVSKPPTQTKTLTYTEKKDILSKFPPKIKWEDIKEEEIYVIPPILYQNRKIIKVILKNDNLLRCHDVDTNGQEGNSFINIYKKDIDVVFITKFLKF